MDRDDLLVKLGKEQQARERLPVQVQTQVVQQLGVGNGRLAYLLGELLPAGHFGRGGPDENIDGGRHGITVND